MLIMLKNRELHTLDEEEIRDEIKRRKILRETREERGQLVRQIADEEGLPHEYCDIDTPGTEEGPLQVEEELLKDDQTYTRQIERGRNKTTETILKENEGNDWYIIVYICLNFIYIYISISN